MPLWKRFGIHTSAQGSQGNVRKQSRKMQETTFAARAKQPSKSLHTGCCDLLWHLKTHARLHVISCDSDSCHVTRVIHMAHVTRMFHGCLPSCRLAVSPSRRLAMISEMLGNHLRPSPICGYAPLQVVSTDGAAQN